MKHHHHEIDHWKRHCAPEKDIDIQLSADRQGRVTLTMKVPTFQQLVGAILSIADYLRSTQEQPARELHLKAGQPERA